MAGKTLKCVACRELVYMQQTLVSKMLRGVHAGKIIHQKCAKLFYDANPVVKGVEPELEFKRPEADIADFVDAFVRRNLRASEVSNFHSFMTSCVNTMNAYTLTPEASGAHWFVAAWFIEPASD